MRKNEKITALYERLSRDDFGKDDDQQRESNSISNQKAMLEEFAARQGFTNIVHFTDDGISGTCFDRPGFLAMMKEVEAGNVEYLCIKDMSRMGRDYLKVGQIMEILRQRGVRLIAINDGVDSARGDDDFTPFRNIMKNIPPFGRIFLLERVMGLEPTISAWKANVLPLHYTRVLSCKWCGRRDLNSYAFRHWNLNPARLPIPPRPQAYYSNLVTRRRFELRTP